jgi:hypothetical protein
VVQSGLRRWIVTPEIAGSNPVVPASAEVAQPVEHGPEKAGVPSSTLGLGTIPFLKFADISSKLRCRAHSRALRQRNDVPAFGRTNVVSMRLLRAVAWSPAGDNPVQKPSQNADNGPFLVDKWKPAAGATDRQVLNRPRNRPDPHLVPNLVSPSSPLQEKDLEVIHRSMRRMGRRAVSRLANGPERTGKTPVPPTEGSSVAERQDMLHTRLADREGDTGSLGTLLTVT